MALIDVIEARDIEAIRQAFRQEIDDLIASYDAACEVSLEPGKVRIHLDLRPRTQEERLRIKDRIALGKGNHQ